MDKSFLARKLQYHVFSEKPSGDKQVGLHNALYLFWHDIWRKTLKELDGAPELHSDEFLRQGERTFLTYENEIIAYFAHNWFDLRLLSEVNHSYFIPYPKDAIDELMKRELYQVMTMGWLCVSSKWRKSSIGSLIAEVILRQAYYRFLESDSAALIAYTRNDRKINTLCYQYGSKCLRSNLKGHNVDIDLIYTLPNEVKDHPDELIRQTCARLWKERTHYNSNTSFDKVRRAA